MNSNFIIPKSSIINKDSYLFLYCLLKSIFIKDIGNRKEKNDKIEEYLKKIREKYKIDLKREYSKDNFENIIKYVKAQNKAYVGEILENILLKLFCSIMKVPQKETINKYIYYNLQNIFGIKNKVKEKQISETNLIRDFILYDKLYPAELQNKEIFYQTSNNVITSTFEYFLILIYQCKLDSVKNRNKKHQFNDISYKLYKYSQNYPYNKEEKRIIQNSIIEFDNIINKVHENYKKKIENNSLNPNISIISYFFFTLFVNYQTINSRLIKYSKKDNDRLFLVPYEYNVIGSSMKAIYAPLICSPMRQDNRINIISMTENDFAEIGMAEMGKNIIFNQNIKVINYNKNRLYSYYFYYLNQASKIYGNYSVQEINLSNNFFNDDIDDYLCDILKKFKNLKTLNLSCNRIRSGISKFMNRLKLYYRKNKTKLEKLNLNKCFLNKSSLYELCECLKSKYCKLKYLYLNLNYMNDFSAQPLLDAIKKNNSLKEVYLNKNLIGNSSIQNIGKVISRFRNSLEVFYLSQNEIKNNDNLLRIASRTKIIYSNEENKNEILLYHHENPSLINLDLSKNGINIKNTFQILLLEQIINDTYLFCLDYSQILYNFEYESPSKKGIHSEFQNEILNLIERLNNIKIKRNKLFEYIENNKIFEEKYYDSFKGYINNKDLNDILVETIKNTPNIFPLYEDTESLLSYELLEVMGKTEKDLYNEKDNYFIQNFIKYMLLYKVNGGLINKWFKGLNKCLILT